MNTLSSRPLSRRRARIRPLLGALALFALFDAAPLFAADLAGALAALERGDYAAAVPQLDELAGRGDAVAITRLATLYQEGRGVPRDATRAAMLYEQAAARGNADAQYNLGNMYLLGEGVPQDDDWAFTYYREAAKQGHRMAQKNVAEFYRAAGLVPPPEEVNAKPRAAAAPPLAVRARDEPPAAAAPAIPSAPSSSPASSDPAYAVGTTPSEYSQDEMNAMQLARKHGIRIADAGSLPPAPPPMHVPRGGSAPPPPPAGADAAPISGSGLATAKELLAAGKPGDARPVLEA
ncbi:MAG: tetratricopeptide repeat protein, partial [Gammaproteobacteria bacterium]